MTKNEIIVKKASRYCFYIYFCIVRIYTKKDWEIHSSILKYNVEQEGLEII